VVDDPELSTYITPAIIDRSPLVIAVSSGGACRCWRAGTRPAGKHHSGRFRPAGSIFHAFATG
jgi:hypothetical protein